MDNNIRVVRVIEDIGTIVLNHKTRQEISVIRDNQCRGCSTATNMVVRNNPPDGGMKLLMPCCVNCFDTKKIDSKIQFTINR